jgi:hypothetical protein
VGVEFDPLQKNVLIEKIAMRLRSQRPLLTCKEMLVIRLTGWSTRKKYWEKWRVEEEERHNKSLIPLPPPI